MAITPFNNVRRANASTSAEVLAAAQGMTVQQKADFKAEFAIGGGFVMPQNESVRAANIAICAMSEQTMMVYQDIGRQANSQPYFTDGENRTALFTTEPDLVSVVLPVNHDLLIESGFFPAYEYLGATNVPLPSVGCRWYSVTSVHEASTVTSVTTNAILAAFVALLPTYGEGKPFINLTGLLSPSEQGMADVATLQAAGCTVLVTGPDEPQYAGFVEVPDTGVLVADPGDVGYSYCDDLAGNILWGQTAVLPGVPVSNAAKTEIASTAAWPIVWLDMACSVELTYFDNKYWGR